MDVKPVMYQDVRQLDAGEVRAEEIQRNSLLQEVDKVIESQRSLPSSGFVLIFICCLLQGENLSCRRGGNTSTWDSGVGGLSSISNIASQVEGESPSLSVAQ